LQGPGFWKKDYRRGNQGLQDSAEVFGVAHVVIPPMKTKQIPDDFRDWILDV
jgi:hypothetical protein